MKAVGVVVARTIILGVLAIACGGLLLVMHAAEAPPSSPPTVEAPASAPLRVHPQLSDKPISYEEAIELYLEHLRADHEFSWKVPFSFYGVVVDEQGQPVPGATVELEWVTYDATTREKYIPMTRKIASDVQGRFALLNQHGSGITVKVNKPGYYFMDNGSERGFEFADPGHSYYYIPDASNPKVFHLRKKLPSEPVVSRDLDMVQSAESPSGKVNLEQGYIKSDGGLTITVNKPYGIFSSVQRFPWSATLTMAEGGLVETNDLYPVLAPAEGYTPNTIIDMTNTNEASWHRGVRTAYYFYLPGTNTYGSLKIDIDPESRRISIKYVRNPAPGDRNLEPEHK